MTNCQSHSPRAQLTPIWHPTFHTDCAAHSTRSHRARAAVRIAGRSSPKKILARLKKLEAEIAGDLEELEAMLG